MRDGTITPKSKTVIAPTSAGKSLQVLNKDGQCANKAQRLTKAVAGKPSTTSTKQQRKPVDSVGSIDKPVLTGSDKLHFSVPVSKLQLARAIEVALLMVKLKEKPLTHRSVKSEWFRHKFVYTFGSHNDARVPVDNNAVENAMRPIALGRKNWLFIGSQQAGERAATLMSLIESAKLNGHDAWAYLKDVLTKLPTWPNSRLAELLPHRWVAPTST